LGETGGVGIGNCDHGDILSSIENQVMFVSVIPVAGMADDGGTERWTTTPVRLNGMNRDSSYRGHAEGTPHKMTTCHAWGDMGWLLSELPHNRFKLAVRS
jgi:hypothetical protein